MQKKHLYAFLDESGNDDFTTTGTKYFTFSSMATVRPFKWESQLIQKKYEFIEAGYDLPYFHASEDRQQVRNEVFKIIADHLSLFRLDSVVVEKRKTGPALQPIEKFYPKMMGYLLRYVFEAPFVEDYDEVLVITDRIPHNKKRKAIEKAIKQTLAEMLPSGKSYSILHHESKSCLSLQVADYCNWAVFRKWEREDLRSYKLIQNSIRSEFDIFRTGRTYYY